MSKTIPVILLGRVGEMARHVTKSLLPEIEVVHFISTPEVAQKDLSRFLNNDRPLNSSSDGVGSQDYSRRPEAILLGLGYFNDIVDELRQTCNGTARGVPWLHGGLSRSEFQEMMMKSPPLSMREQGSITSARIKKQLLQLLNDGKGGKDGVYVWYER